MSQDKRWKSTKDGSQPTGRKVKGTLKDISLIQCFPRFIEAVDLESQKQGKPRSEVIRKVQRETRDIDFSNPERDALTLPPEFRPLKC